MRRLFNWQPCEAPLYVALPDGEDAVKYVAIDERKAIVRSDTGAVLGVFKDGYQIHSYETWLLDNVAHIVGGSDLGIASAGLLDGGAVAWLQIRTPEIVKMESGIEYLPFIIAATSANGTLASQYGDANKLAVCDNTLPTALSSGDNRIKVRHTRHSGARIEDVQTALRIIAESSAEFEAEVNALLGMAVSEPQYEAVRDELIPLPTDKNKRGTTVAQGKRLEIDTLYQYDRRVSPWQGTGFGVVQAFNTWQHWNAQVRKGAERADRNMGNVLSGKFQMADRNVVSVLNKVLATA
jgi:phage/plasmid-like protein (TIGR03299 family)